MKPNTAILLLEDKLWLLGSQVDVPIYDFNFRDLFHTGSPYNPPAVIDAVARVGAPADYDQFYGECQQDGIKLINSSEEHRRANQLDVRYPLLSEMTPKSLANGASFCCPAGSPCIAARVATRFPAARMRRVAVPATATPARAKKFLAVPSRRYWRKSLRPGRAHSESSRSTSPARGALNRRWGERPRDPGMARRSIVKTARR